MPPTEDDPRFEDLDWDEIRRSKRTVTAERAVLAAGVILLVLGRAYQASSPDLYLIGDWRPVTLDWVFLLAGTVLAAYGAVPFAKRLRRRRVSLRDLVRRRPAVALSGAFVVGLAAVGVVGPALGGSPPLRFQHAFHPPVGFASTVPPQECLGVETGGVFERVCHGTWEYPLGTNKRGHPLGFLLVEGARTATYVAVISAAFIVPLAAAVGVVAGIRGGVVDALLSSYVDVQLCIPALLLYFVGYAYYGPSLLLLLGTFGLLSWGGIARLVRSEVIQRREEGYVLVARSLGASGAYVARRHILPNSTNTLVPAIFQLLALFVLIEAGVAFLGFHEIGTYSWGSTISESINAAVAGQLQEHADKPAYKIWWVSSIPAAALTVTLVAFKTLGDGVRDALDPRGDRS
ncbi:ABC transporter permease [Halorubrum sp. BOL3-1]|uniref:ABC transporter permease n=1 Tax=Halorubrum sp. BOL3-1 TaxID=2497325 RepID=UPI00100506E3|nr:ABC transporter permease [Halorubrum sp. BOL3-1]QAU12662.1 ABC transporter permease [Halorubrum sp. BOL3-1]